MQAGRELDAKVAEALGWHWAETDFGLEGLFPPEGDIRYNSALYGPLRFDKDGYLETMPNYSTSWHGMGVLVEDARKHHGALLQFETYLDEYVGNVVTDSDEDGFRDYLDHTLSFEATAPHAVCMAFLKLKGVVT